MITHTQESEAVFATVSTVALSGPLLRKGGKLSVPAHCCVAAEAQVTSPSANNFISEHTRRRRMHVTKSG